jgi:mRNA interferase MazF
MGKISLKQGEIWEVNLNPTIGAEIKKSRPCIIVNDNAMGILPLKIIAPITEWKEHYRNFPWMVQIKPGCGSGLSKISSIDCFQLRSISVERMINKIGGVEYIIIEQTKEAISKVIGI